MNQLVLDDIVELSNTGKLAQCIARELENSMWSQLIKVEEKTGFWTIVSLKQTAVWIRRKKKEIHIEFKPEYNSLFENREILQTKDGKSYIAVKSIDNVIELAHPICAVAVEELSCGERFGCCSRYEQCSDERKCINPDQFMALACVYRKNLENGKIFYGKNKNC